MDSEIVRLIDIKNKPLTLGFVGENDRKRFLFDCRPIFTQYPNAYPSIAVKPPVGEIYPAVLTVNGDYAIWVIKSSDLAQQGDGEYQLTFTQGTTIVKTYDGKTEILKSIETTGDAPSGVQTWLDYANEVIASIPETIDTALAEAKASGEFDGADGKDGADGYTPIKGVDYFDGQDGKDGADGYTPVKGVDYFDGQDGYTPVKGVDYFDGQNGADGKDGQDGYTPVKGVDYFDGQDGKDGEDGKDGQDGYTPVKGVDYFDGEKGETGDSGVYYGTQQPIDPDVNVWIDPNGEEDPIEELEEAITELSESMFYVTPEAYGAVGDGVADDSQAIQDACNDGYAVYFGSNKTYYLAEPVIIDHDCHLFGGKNTVIKTKTPSGGMVNNGIVISGALKKTTTLTSDYSKVGSSDNCNNKFTLSDMNDIDIGDLLIIKATDQHYHYARQYYYLGTTLLITDIYDGHIYTADTMPFNIENTEDVSVKIYSSPSVIIENINFVSDLNSLGAYKYLLLLERCKSSTIKNCSFSQMANGIRITECSNIKFDEISLAKSKYDNSISGDGYGIFVDGCTNTVFERIIATCAQHAITVSGNLVTMNTFVKHCNFTAECRTPGFDTHECTYNLVIEDSIIATAALNATCTLNRCKVFANRRAESSGTAIISIYGSHDPELSRVRILNTNFDENSGIAILRSVGQDPIQSYNNVFGSIEVENCIGGTINLNLESTSMCLSNTINKLSIKNWRGCKEIFNSGQHGTIKSLIIKDSSFIESQYINNHSGVGGFAISNIGFLDVSDVETQTHKMIVKRATRGECFNLPKNVPIGLSATNQSAKYVVCGANITPNNNLDWVVGSVTGSDGGTLSRTVASGNNIPSIAFNASGNLVWTQGDNTTKYAVYPIGLVYVKMRSNISISCKVVNSGNTDAEAFRPFIAIVNRETGVLTKRTSGDSVSATVQGADLSFSYDCGGESVIMAYLGCATAVSGAETTFENLKITLIPNICAMSYDDEPYEAKRLTGDGTILSLQGVNNIMCSELDFNINLQADMMG